MENKMSHYVFPAVFVMVSVSLVLLFRVTSNRFVYMPRINNSTFIQPITSIPIAFNSDIKITMVVFSCLTLAPSPPPPPSPTPPPPATPEQLNNISHELIGAGDFENWVNIITGANPLVLPLSATLFIPQDNALNRLPTSDPLMFPYHVVPQRLTFADLQLFKPNSRLPTLLPGKSILITNNSRSNFTVDDSPLTQPDLYLTTTVAVHGLGAILDYSVYGDGLNLLPSPNSEHPPPQGGVPPTGEMTRWRSDAAPPCLCFEFPVGFLVVCASAILVPVFALSFRLGVSLLVRFWA